MTKAMTNLDTRFLENLTAMAIHQKELCELLADQIDTPDAMRLLESIYEKAEKIKQSALEQRDYIKQRRTP